jgi:hypothetical protein
MKWIVRLSETDPLFLQYELLRKAVNELSWVADISRIKAIRNGLRILLTHEYNSLKEITDADLSNIPADARVWTHSIVLFAPSACSIAHRSEVSLARVASSALARTRC